MALANLGRDAMLTDATAATETVLLVLLQNFKFEPTGKPIKWNLAAVQYPSVASEGREPALPLLVSALHP